MFRIAPKEETALLQLASNGPAYGLEMVKNSDGQLGRGTVYVILDRLEKKGWIKSRLVEAPPGNRGPARRKYELTGDGVKVACALNEMASMNARTLNF